MGKNNRANIILIGCGPHSRRVYLPAINEIKHLKLELVIDLESQEANVRSSLKNFPETELLLVDPFESCLPANLSSHLTKYVKEKEILGVIIATEPLVHKAYADWAIQNGLNILMDKPITARANAVSDFSNAKGIQDDFLHILENYRNLQLQK